MLVGNKTNATQSEKPMSAKISFTEKFSFGLGDFASGLVFNVVTMFLVFYYTDFVGMNAGVIGTIILFSRIFDGITDVVMGVIVDRTKSKHGKAGHGYYGWPDLLQYVQLSFFLFQTQVM